MAANLGDKFRKVGASTVTTLAAPGKALSATSINVGSTTNYPTDTGIVIAMRQVNTDGQVVQGTYTTWNAIVSSPTSLTISSTPRKGSDQVYPAGSTTQVYMVVSSDSQNDLIDGILVQHAQDGTHKDVTTNTITATTGTFTNLVVGSQTPTADWTTLGATPNTVTYNGNRSYDLVFNGTDLTSTVNPGTRIRTTRTAAAPTQSTSLNGTNQYWVKTSPSKLTFTDDFVVSAWVKLSSYIAGAIASRFNGTSGWALQIDATGQVRLRGFNAGSGNESAVYSYQSIPLNKWVHITAQLDMSTFTATTTTSYVMLDGIDVPAAVIRAGSNPTALIQAGNLEIGSYNAGAFFPGRIAQVAIFNSKVTQATMRGYISQGLTGTESNLASAFSFNGVAADLNTTTPNDLTPAGAGSGTLTATNVDSPFGGQASGSISPTIDYAIIQTATFSTNSTLTVQVPEGCTIPTSGGVSTVSYSSAGKPFGFPSSRGKWSIESIYNITSGLTVTAGSFANVASAKLSVLPGEQIYGFRGSVRTTNGGGTGDAILGLSTSTGSITDALTRVRGLSTIAGVHVWMLGSERPYNNTTGALQSVYLVETASTNTVIDIGEAPMIIYAENAYL